MWYWFIYGKKFYQLQVAQRQLLWLLNNLEKGSFRKRGNLQKFKTLIYLFLCVFVFNVPQQLRSYGGEPQLKVSSDKVVKPGNKPSTPGLQGKRFIHYTTVAPIVAPTNLFLLSLFIRIMARVTTQMPPSTSLSNNSAFCNKCFKS